MQAVHDCNHGVDVVSFTRYYNPDLDNGSAHWETTLYVRYHFVHSAQRLTLTFTSSDSVTCGKWIAVTYDPASTPDATVFATVQPLLQMDKL